MPPDGNAVPFLLVSGCALATIAASMLLLPEMRNSNFY
jgi:hypothetical protein